MMVDLKPCPFCGSATLAIHTSQRALAHATGSISEAVPAGESVKIARRVREGGKVDG